MSKRQVGTLGFLALTLSLCLCACRGPYSIGSKYSGLIGKTVRLKKDMVICSTEGHNFRVSGYVMLTPKQAFSLEITPDVEVKAGETLQVMDLICAIDKTGESCDFVCVYERRGRKYRFYVGGFEERSVNRTANQLWEYPSMRHKEPE